MTTDLKSDKTKKIKEEIKITKDMNLGEIIFKYPEVAEIFTDYGLHCVGCFASSFDTIEMGAKVHQLSDEEIEEMVNRVNELINHGE